MAKNLDSLVGVMLNKSNDHTGLRLSDVFYVKPSELYPNPMNKIFFKQESEEYFERMVADIKERGILVPLIAKNDGTLLAGHNRLTIAHQLGITKIPVQYLEDELSEQQEKEFIIKDNIFRRQHSSDEWLSLYRTLYPNFEQRLVAHGRPQQKNSSRLNKNQPPISPEKKADMSGFSPTQHNEFRQDVDNAPLTVKKIAHDTGQTVAAVQKQLHRAGLRSPDKQNKNTNNSNSKQNGSQRIPEDNHKHLNIKLIKKQTKAFEQFLEKSLANIEHENAATQKKIIQHFKQHITAVQQRLFSEKT